MAAITPCGQTISTVQPGPGAIAGEPFTFAISDQTQTQAQSLRTGFVRAIEPWSPLRSISGMQDQYLSLNFDLPIVVMQSKLPHTPSGSFNRVVDQIRDGLEQEVAIATDGHLIF